MPKKILATDQVETPEADILGKRLAWRFSNRTVQPTVQIQ